MYRRKLNGRKINKKRYIWPRGIEREIVIKGAGRVCFIKTSAPPPAPVVGISVQQGSYWSPLPAGAP